MQNEKTNPSKNIPKEYSPSKIFKIFLTKFYLIFLIPPLILTPLYIHNKMSPYYFNICLESYYDCCNEFIPFLFSMILVFLFGLILRKAFLNIINYKNITKKQAILKVLMWICISIFFIASLSAWLVKSFIIPALYQATGKPIIYLYPEKTMDVKVKLDFKGTVKATYPDYDYSMKGWEVEAHPDGKLINKKDNQEYSYLFWDGDIAKSLPLDTKNGFVVKGSDTKIFLQKTLKQIGLTPKEYNEFIVYWYPMMMNNKYNFIHFVGKDYTDIAPLSISPQPDSVLRVFMVFKALEKPIDVKPQIFEPFERKGFTVVEWGGIESK